jgi:hypothetical protein
MIYPSKTPATGLAILALAIAGCATVHVVPITDPGDFARNLFTIADKDDVRAWAGQLTEARRARGHAYVQRHFEFWEKNLNELRPAFGRPLEEVKFRVTDEGGLEFESDGKWRLLLRVAMEDGGWKINQD